MNGIVFFRTRELDEVVRFYTEELGGVIWLEQSGCTIVRHGNLLTGFCRAERAQTDGLITLFTESREEVDRVYRHVEARATLAPRYNERYRIYHFYGEDPERRPFEVQCFDSRPSLWGEERC